MMSYKNLLCGIDDFMQWWSIVLDTHQVKVRYVTHMACHESLQMQKSDLSGRIFIDDNSQPNGRNTDTGSAGAQYFFHSSSLWTTLVREKEEKASHSLLCEFNQSQREKDREGCSERSAFWWLKEDKPKHAVCPHQADYCDRCKELQEINRQKTILQRLRHGGDCSCDFPSTNQAETDHRQEAQEALEHYKFITQKLAIIDLASKDSLDSTSQARL